MTQNNWLEHNLKERLYDFSLDFKLQINETPYQLTNFKTASFEVVNLVDRLDMPIFISFSGGMDSEYVVKCFLEAGTKFTPIIVKTSGNDYESSYAFHFCRKYSIPFIVIEKTDVEILSIFYKEIFKKLNSKGINSTPALIAGMYAKQQGGVLVKGEHLIDDDRDWRGTIDRVGSNEWDFYNDVLVGNTVNFFLETPNIAVSLVREIRAEESVQEFKHRMFDIPFRPKFSYKYPKLYNEALKEIKKKMVVHPNHNFSFEPKETFLEKIKG